MASFGRDAKLINPQKSKFRPLHNRLKYSLASPSDFGPELRSQRYAFAEKPPQQQLAGVGELLCSQQLRHYGQRRDISSQNSLPFVHFLLSVMSSNLVCGSYNIKKHREVFEAGEANKLYATRPTSGSFNNDPYSKAGLQRSKLLAGGANGNVNDSINDELPVD